MSSYNLSPKHILFFWSATVRAPPKGDLYTPGATKKDPKGKNPVQKGSTYTVVFTKPREGFGLEFAAGDDCKVAKLEPGRTAEKCGNIKPGHIIISANGGAESCENNKVAMLQSMKRASKNDVPFDLMIVTSES